MAVKKKVNASMSSFIDKGADVKSKKDEKHQIISLRVPRDLIVSIDEELENNPDLAELDRTKWIVKTIREKLKKDGKFS